MKKKILALSLAIALVAVGVIGGTLAWMTDTEVAKNTFTVGNVDIELKEPHFFKDDNSDWGYIEPTFPAENEEYGSEAAKLIAPGRKILKDPIVKNTGNSDAYVRLKVTVPGDIANKYIEGLKDPNKVIINATKDGTIEQDKINILFNNEFDTYWVEDIKYDYDKELDKYLPKLEGSNLVIYYEYKNPLKSGEKTEVLFNKIVIGEAMDDELKGITGFDVVVEAQAIQTEGFADADAAFKALDEQLQ